MLIINPLYYYDLLIENENYVSFIKKLKKINYTGIKIVISLPLIILGTTFTILYGIITVYAMILYFIPYILIKLDEYLTNKNEIKPEINLEEGCKK